MRENIWKWSIKTDIQTQKEWVYRISKFPSRDTLIELFPNETEEIIN